MAIFGVFRQMIPRVVLFQFDRDENTRRVLFTSQSSFKLFDERGLVGDGEEDEWYG